MDVESFIPTYPDLDDDMLQQNLYNKTEFSHLDKSNAKVDDVYFTFQQNIARLLSPYTPYKKMLVYYDVGVGKTCSAILTHELSKLIERGEFRETIVITSGPSLEQNFKDQFIRKCPGIIKDFTSGHLFDEIGLKRQVRSNFKFRKYGEFATFINGSTKNGKIIRKEKSDEFIKRTYSNRIFVLDEGHILKNKGPRYNAIQRVFDVAENLTILILTGSPITEQPVEGVNLINLLKPPSERMIIGDSGFIKEYYTDLKFREEKRSELLNFYKGYVTYLKQTGDIIKTVFAENPKYPNTFQDFKTYNVSMSKFQNDVYQKSLKEKKKTIKRGKNPMEIIFASEKEIISKEGGAFDKFALSSSIFVFPDETYGSDGYKANMANHKFKNSKVEMEVVNNLKKYSAVYYQALKIIESEPTRVFYIHFDILDNLHFFALLLEKKLGFKYWNGKSSRFACNKATYVKIIQEQTRVKNDLQKILDQIGSEQNAGAKCIRVALGSPVSGVGLTIPTATRVMVIGAQVSPEDIIQIPARINRPGSLKWLIKNGLPIDCETYLFCAIANQGVSIDLHVYTLAQNKYILNAPQYELLKEADPLCLVSRGRNGSIKCINKKGGEPDSTTDLLYWRQDDIENLKTRILEKIHMHGFVNVTDLLEDHDGMIIYRTVKEMSRERLQVDGQTVFIMGDLIFVDPTVSGDPNSAFYLKTQTFPTDINLYDIMSARLLIDHDQPILEKMVSGPKLQDFKRLSKYTQNELWEESYLRQNDKFTQTVATFNPVYEINGVTYNVVWAEPISNERTNFLVPIENPMKIRKLVDNRWVFVGTRNLGELYPSLDETLDVNEQRIRKEMIYQYKNQYKILAKQINEIENKKIREYDNNDYGFSGFIDKTGKFKIKILGGKNRGKVCDPSFSKADHMMFFQRLGLLKDVTVFGLKKIKMTDDDIKQYLVTIKNFTPPEDFSRKEIIAAITILLPGTGLNEGERCKILQTTFRERGILKE